MKTILTAILAALLVSAAAHAASVTFPHEANFQTNVYLHDAPSTPLHTRVPTGNVLRATASYIRPEQDLILQGNLTLDTNKSLTLVNDSGVGIVSNGVVLGYNGEITLRRFISGVGWVSALINPTNPLPAAMRPSGEFVTTNDARNLALGNGNIYDLGTITLRGPTVVSNTINVFANSAAGVGGIVVTNSGGGSYGLDVRSPSRFDSTLYIWSDDMRAGGDTSPYRYIKTRIVTNADPTTVTPPTAWHGAEMQDVGLTQRLIRAFGATTNDWVTVYP